MNKYTRFQDIPAFTRTPGYHVDVGWDYLETWLKDHQEQGPKLDLDPDFQRAHVWTEAQQVAFVEYALRGGLSGKQLYFNHPYWMSFKSPEVVAKKKLYYDFVLVDGKQRMTAALRFLRNEIPAFGSYRREYTDRIRLSGPSFSININDLKTKAEVLTWYLEMNTGGTPHTDEEIEKVRRMLKEEK